MEPLLKSDSYYKMSRYDSISSPYDSYWLYFIDDMPEYGWGHDCRYVFVNSGNGAVSVTNSHIPPLHFKLYLDVVSEPVSFPTPTINTFSGNQNPISSNYPSNDGKYAFLFTGGEEDGSSLRAFWNALSHSYCSLVENGFKKENIFVLSCDGKVGVDPASNDTLDLDGDGLDDILKDTCCNVMGFRMVFDSLSHIVKEGDLLYVFGTTHGLQDEYDCNRYYLRLWKGDRLYDTTFSNMLSSVNCSQYIVNLCSCYSGAIMNEFIIQTSQAKKTVLTCVGNNPSIRYHSFIGYAGMDTYNYFINSALRNCHPYRSDSVWMQGNLIGQLQDSLLFKKTQSNIYSDINYDSINHGGNGNGIHEINEAINYTKRYEIINFAPYGVKHYECGFIEDLLSLRGITGTVHQSQTVQGSFHIEDTLSVQTDTLALAAGTKFYLFDADLVVQEGSLLQMLDGTSIIARSGDCRVVVRGSLETGSRNTFEARDGASLEIVFQNDTAVDIHDATFVDCAMTLPRKSVAFRNCSFLGTSVSAQINSLQNTGSETVTISGCSFAPNGRTLENAIHIKGYPRFTVSGCAIGNANAEGSFAYGVNVHNSGNAVNSSVVANNEIADCTAVGLQFYHSTGNIKNNRIHDNGFGVKLLNYSNVGEFSGRCNSATAEGTQYIHDNDRDEVYMTGSSVPEVFRYNAISDDDEEAFLHCEVSGDVNGNDSLYRTPIDVAYNYWGSHFVPGTHLYPDSSCYQYLPQWSLGTCYGNGHEPSIRSEMVEEADSLAGIGEYAAARLLYKRVVGEYTQTTSAETALKSLLNLEKQVGGDFESLQDYYLTEQAIAEDETLAHLASSLANKCDEETGRYEEAVSWYENVLTDPNTTFNDSVFAAIDLGDLYLAMEQEGEKGVCGKMKQYVPKSVATHQKQTAYALSLLPLEKAEPMKRENSPITKLEAVIYDNDTVLLTWGLPEEYSSLPMILSWTRSDTVEDQIQYGMDSFMAHFYDADDLENFQGWKIDAVVYQKVCNWAYELYVWEQVPGEDMELLFIQEIPDSVPLGKYIINLQEDIHIEPNVQYYFGIRAYWESGKDRAYPFAVDNGPVVTGKGLLLKSKLEGGWDPTSYYVPCNFWLQVYVNNSYDSKEIPIKEDPSLSGYRIYRDGELVKEIPYSFVTYFKDTEYTRGFDVEYCVTALYGDEESEPVCVTATITGANEIDSPEKFTISPNPTSGTVRIEGETIAEIKVYNTLGQLVKTVRNANEVDLKGMPKGVYSLSITEESGGVVLKKVIKE